MQALHEIVLTIGGNLWNLVIILAIFLGIYYGFRSKFVQFRLFPETLRIVLAKARQGRAATVYPASKPSALRWGAVSARGTWPAWPWRWWPADRGRYSGCG